jgi:hypothetical protein
LLIFVAGFAAFSEQVQGEGPQFLHARAGRDYRIAVPATSAFVQGDWKELSLRFPVFASFIAGQLVSCSNFIVFPGEKMKGLAKGCGSAAVIEPFARRLCDCWLITDGCAG